MEIYLPVLPSLRLITSSAYLIPLPLYTSGGLFVLILAAVWPTNSLSIPFTIIVFGFGTSKEIPAGASNTTGCEYPNVRFKLFPCFATL